MVSTRRPPALPPPVWLVLLVLTVCVVSPVQPTEWVTESAEPLLSYLATRLRTDVIGCDREWFVSSLSDCWKADKTTADQQQEQALTSVALHFRPNCRAALSTQSCSVLDSSPDLSARQMLDGLSAALNHTYCFQYFDAGSVLEEMPAVNSDQLLSTKERRTLATYVVRRLLRGECVGVGAPESDRKSRMERSPPDPTINHYLDHLFAKYADNDTHQVTIDGLNRLLVDVQLDPPDNANPSNDTSAVETASGSSGQLQQRSSRRRRRSVRSSDQLAAIRPAIRPPSVAILLRRMLSLETFQQGLRTALDDSQQQEFDINKCLSGSELLQMFDVDESSGLNETELLQVCAYVVSQISSGRQCEAEYNPADPFDAAKVYGYGTLCVFVISACSALGFLIIPTLSASIYDILMTSFIALAFGTLTGDALLHLFPQSLLGDAANAGYDGITAPDSFYKCLVIMFSIYLLYVFEGLTGLLVGHNHASDAGEGGGEQHGHSHAHSHDFVREQTEKAKQVGKEHDHHHNHQQQDLKLELNGGDTVKDPAPPPPPLQHKTSFTLSETGSENTMMGRSQTSDDENVITPILLNEDQLPVCLGLTSLALVIIVGDAIHNVTDGISIGASFAHDIKGGLSTALAVFFHELPHEFGDFVILLTTGLSLKQALLWNFVSSLTAFVGLYIGIAVGENEDAIDWIFAMTSGMFLYVAIADMLPEMRNIKSHRPYIAFLAQNIGALFGMGFMIFMFFLEDFMQF